MTTCPYICGLLIVLTTGNPQMTQMNDRAFAPARCAPNLIKARIRPPLSTASLNKNPAINPCARTTIWASPKKSEKTLQGTHSVRWGVCKDARRHERATVHEPIGRKAPAASFVAGQLVTGINNNNNN
jgi:hypothetical protein